MIKVLPPKTAKEVVAREMERKARTTLPIALPEEHLEKFHKMADAKEMWEAIKSIFGGNDKSKKMHKYLLKQQFQGIYVSASEGLDKGYDRFQTLLSQLEIHDLKWQVAMISMRIKKFHKRTGRKLQFDTKDPVGFDKTKMECFNCYKIGHFARDCRAKKNQDIRRRDVRAKKNQDIRRRDVRYNRNKTRDNGRRPAYQDDSKAFVTIDGKDIDWSGHVEEDAQNYAMMAYSLSNLGSDNECRITAYTLALKKVEAQLLCHQQNQLAYEQKIRFRKIDLDDKTDVLAYHKKLLAEARKEKEDLKTKFENWQNSSKNLSRLLNTQMRANDKFGLGYGDYRYGSILSYENKVLQSVFLNKESDLENTSGNDRYAAGMHATLADESDYKPSENAFCESDSSVETTTSMPEPVDNAPKVICEPKVRTDAPIIEEYESDSDNDSVSNVQEDKEKPSFAFIDSIKHVKTSRKNVQETDTPNHTPKVEKQDRNGHTRKDLGYVFTRKACFDTAVKASAECNWRNKRNSWKKVFKYNSRSKFRKSVKDPLGILKSEMAWVPKRNRFLLFHVQDDPHRALKDKGIVDSGCSRHMTENKAHLADYQEFKGVYVSFRGSNGRITGLWYPKVSSFDLEDYSDSDYAGANLDRKSTTGGYQFLGRRLISWQRKKQNIVATSTTEAKYVAAAHCVDKFCGFRINY
nr:ribonuclease H-like domain-containing protein [Tanacetum cinerariifolium]